MTHVEGQAVIPPIPMPSLHGDEIPIICGIELHEAAIDSRMRTRGQADALRARLDGGDERERRRYLPAGARLQGGFPDERIPRQSDFADAEVIHRRAVEREECRDEHSPDLEAVAAAHLATAGSVITVAGAV